jgi:hypothetical protein
MEGIVARKPSRAERGRPPMGRMGRSEIRDSWGLRV